MEKLNKRKLAIASGLTSVIVYLVVQNINP
jgi:hypothetical protein